MDRRSFLMSVSGFGLLPILPKILHPFEPKQADMPPKGWKMIWSHEDVNTRDWHVVFNSPDNKRWRWYVNGRFSSEGSYR